MASALRILTMPGMCQNCGVKPANQGHAYCSKTCGQEARGTTTSRQPSIVRRAATLSSRPAVAGSPLCSNCGVRPRNRGYEYCGRACGRAAAQGGGVTRRSSLPPPNPLAFLSQPSTPIQDPFADDAYQRDGPYTAHTSRVAPLLEELDDDEIEYDFDYPRVPRRPRPPPYRQSDVTTPGHYDEDSGAEDRGNGGGRSGLGAVPGPSTSRAPRPPLPRGIAMCMNCQRNPKVAGFDFCSKYCRSQAQAKLAGYPTRGMQNLFMGGGPGLGAAAVQRGGGRNQCQIRGCHAVEFRPGSKYCGNTCRERAVQQKIETACLMCKKFPKNHRKHFCGRTCGKQAQTGAPLLLDLPKEDPKFADIVKQFTQTWTVGTAPTVHRICKVVNAKATEERYQTYRKAVEAVGKFSGGRSRRTAGNEQRRWHGTVRQCTIGDTATNLAPCASATCRLCCIIRTSFSTSNSNCIGGGIYTSAFSSTSHGYTRAATVGSPYRAMFLTRVVVGRNHVGGYAPVANTDSTAIDTKHTELIVFRNDAICPSWLVLYA